MKLKPLQDWAVIQRLEPEEMTAAGIIIPDAARDKPTEGIVIAIGPGKYKKEKDDEKKKKFIPTVLRPGDRIIYGKYAAREIELDGELLGLVREEDVLGIVEEAGLSAKKSFEVAVKHHHPVQIKKEGSVMKTAAPPAKKEKDIGKAEIKRERPALKSAEKKGKKIAVTVKKTKKSAQKPINKTGVKKTVTTKSAEKTVTRKGAKTTAAAKKRAVPAKKVVVKKPSAKKTIGEKTAARGTKRIVQKKTVTARKIKAVKRPPAKNTVRTKK